MIIAVIMPVKCALCRAKPMSPVPSRTHQILLSVCVPSICDEKAKFLHETGKEREERVSIAITMSSSKERFALCSPSIVIRCRFIFLHTGGGRVLVNDTFRRGTFQKKPFLMVLNPAFEGNAHQFSEPLLSGRATRPDTELRTHSWLRY